MTNVKQTRQKLNFCMKVKTCRKNKKPKNNRSKCNFCKEFFDNPK